MTIQDKPHCDQTRQLRDATCDVCGAKAEINCRLGDDGQANRKLQSMGWSFVKRKHYCPTCERDRRKKSRRKPEATMAKNTLTLSTPKKAPPKAVAPDNGEAARMPSPHQKREIFMMLETAYDTAAGRFKGNDTDDTIADVLSVMPGWVAQIRDEFFGPAGHNQNIDELMARLDAFEQQVKQSLTVALKCADTLQKAKDDVAMFREDVARVKAALSPRHGIK